MKLALYARVSTEKQEDEKTIDSQIAEIEVYVKEHEHTIVERYIDNGFSGTLLARPELDRLRDDASKKLFEAVIIHSPDRLARKYIYQGLVAEELKNKGIQVMFLNRPIGETAEDQLLLNVQGVIAEYERTKFVERTRRGRLHKARQGNVLGNTPPYGYTCTKKAVSPDGQPKYEINPDEAKVVELIFSMLVNDQATIYKIVTSLNDLGFKARKGGRWAKSTVGKIVRNETYIGTTHYNKHYAIPSQNSGKNDNGQYRRRSNTLLRLRHKSEWIAIPNIPAIISDDIFAKAQVQLSVNERLSTRNAKHIYLLRGLVKCGIDGRSYYGVPMHGKRSYRCAAKNKLVSPVGCGSSMISADSLEGVVWAAMVEIVSEPQLVLSQLRAYRAKMLNGGQANSPRLSAMSAKITKLEEEEQRYIVAYGEKVFNLDQLKAHIARITKEKSELADKMSSESDELTARKQIPKALEIKTYLRRFKPVLENMTMEQKAEFLRSIIVQITVENREISIEGVVPASREVALRPQSPAPRAARCRKNIIGSWFARALAGARLQRAD